LIGEITSAAQRNLLDAAHRLDEIADDALRAAYRQRVRVVAGQAAGHVLQRRIGGGFFLLLQFGQRIDVAEGGGIVEQDLGHLDRLVPAVHAARPGGQVGVERRQGALAHQGEHRMQLRVRVAGFVGFQRGGDGQVGALRVQRIGQALRQVGRQERGVARRRQQQIRLAMAQAGLYAGQRAFIAFQFVLQHRHAQRAVGAQVAVGVDGDAGHLRREPLQHMRGERAAAKGLQAFVDAPHAGAAAARQDQCTDAVFHRQLIPRCMTFRPCARHPAPGLRY
jgi:hypothetical protein